MEGENVGVILGHNPVLSIAEVFVSYKNMGDLVALDKDFCVLKDVDIDELLVQAENLGGIPKLFRVYGECTKENLRKTSLTVIENYIKEREMSEKILFSVSVYGKDRRYQKDILLSLKKELREMYPERKVRFIHKLLDKNVFGAQLKTEKIIEKGIDLVICERHGKYYVGISAWIQDVDSYTKRDIEKPWRDMRNGILPPKLAQTMLNLTLDRGVVWDPFCGSGVILMEAMLASSPSIGSDISQEMIKESDENIAWFTTQEEYLHAAEIPYDVFLQDATQIQSMPVLHGQCPERVVTEGFLGRNFTQMPTLQEIEKTREEVLTIWKSFFKCLEPITKPGFEVVFTMPVHEDRKQLLRLTELFAFLTRTKFRLEPLLPERISKSMDPALKTVFSLEGTILYKREGQFVGREIVKAVRI